MPPGATRSGACQEGRFLVIGQFVDARVMRERGLPSPNWAGSNRMRRLAGALRTAGMRPVILSPGTALRMRRVERLWHEPTVRRAGRVPVLYARAMGFPFLGVLLEPLFLILAARALFLRGGGITGAMVYNFSPGLVVVALFLAVFRGVPIHADLEDLSVPRASDWAPGSAARPFQQLVYWGCMKAILRVAESVVVPTRRFLEAVPPGKPALVVTGCLEDSELCTPGAERPPGPVRVLMAGELDRENGFDVFRETASRWRRDAASSGAIEFFACGHGGVAPGAEGDVKVLGALEQDAFRRLLSSVDVCVALQRPDGRWNGLKTPSKVFEFLGAGKVVVTTDTGDFDEIAGPHLLVCESCDPGSLSARLREIVADTEGMMERRRSAAQCARERFSAQAVGFRLSRFLVGEDPS